MIRRSYVDTSVGQVHYRTAGSRRTGVPLVLLHQTASSSVMFEGLMTRLADTRWIFAPDTPGFGGTEPLAERATIAGYARVLMEACQRMDIRDCDLFGHHTGASIAVQMEHDRPGFARRMALSGPPYLTPAAKAELRAKTVPVVLDAEGAHLGAVWRRLRSKDRDASLALLHRESILTLVAGDRYHEAYDAVFDHDFEGQLAAVACPTLVMAGDADTLFASLEPARRALRHGTMRVIPGATTYVVDRAPDTVAALLREHFGA